MKVILACALLMLVLQIITPYWWWIMLVPFFFGVFAGRSAAQSFGTGALSAGGLWLVASVYLWSTASRQTASRVIVMMGIEANGVSLVLAAALLAGVVAGIAGTSGYLLRTGWRR